jgi:class 3 adenylate cyclase
VGFTTLASHLDPAALVDLLNDIFSRFDALAAQLNLEKIKTIGDAYMVAAGLPIPRTDHAPAIADMALAMQETILMLPINHNLGGELKIRIGINTGKVVAGVIGTHKFIYDLWGDTVNVSSRMESSGEPGRIQVAESAYFRLKDSYQFEERGEVTVKGKGLMKTYWLLGKQ